MSVVREDLTYSPDKVAHGALLAKVGAALLVGGLLGYMMNNSSGEEGKLVAEIQTLKADTTKLKEEKQDLTNKITNLEATNQQARLEINGLRAQLNEANEKLISVPPKKKR
jgi:uncharacterized protein YlxW (UPF0749 family)